jgi:hypothetical protein
VNGGTCRLKGKEGKLLALLLERCGQVVTFDEIDTAVWGASVKTNTRNQKINDIRRKIRQFWLNWPADSGEKPELEILENREEGFVLHAYVEQPCVEQPCVERGQ